MSWAPGKKSTKIRLQKPFFFWRHLEGHINAWNALQFLILIMVLITGYCTRSNPKLIYIWYVVLYLKKMMQFKCQLPVLWHHMIKICLWYKTFKMLQQDSWNFYWRYPTSTVINIMVKDIFKWLCLWVIALALSQFGATEHFHKMYDVCVHGNVVSDIVVSSNKMLLSTGLEKTYKDGFKALNSVYLSKTNESRSRKLELVQLPQYNIRHIGVLIVWAYGPA